MKNFNLESFALRYIGASVIVSASIGVIALIAIGVDKMIVGIKNNKAKRAYNKITEEDINNALENNKNIIKDGVEFRVNTNTDLFGNVSLELEPVNM